MPANTDDFLGNIADLLGEDHASEATLEAALAAGEQEVAEAIESALTEPESDPGPSVTEGRLRVYDMFDGWTWADTGERIEDEDVEEAGLPTQDTLQSATEDDIRRQLIDEQMATYEGQHGQQAWREELARRERKRQVVAEAAAKFEDIRSYMASYLVFPDKYKDAYLDLMATWVIHTYAHKTQGVTPYLKIIAPTKGSGKTTVLEILSTLAHNPSAVEVTPTGPVVRVYAEGGHSLFLDEIDTLANDKNFVAVMNSGYKAGGSVTRVGRKQGDTYTEKSNTFCPKAIAGIAEEGDLALPPATLDRCIEMRIFRAKPGELTKRFRVKIMAEEPQVLALRQWAEMWAYTQYTEIRDAYFDIPELSSSRAQEIWEPLITIAGLLGTDIYERVCKAAMLIDASKVADPDKNTAMVADLHRVMTTLIELDSDICQIKVDDLAEARSFLAGSKLQGRLSSDQLVRRLAAFGIQPELAKVDGEETQVYTFADHGELLPDWVDLFDRYGPR